MELNVHMQYRLQYNEGYKAAEAGEDYDKNWTSAKREGYKAKLQEIMDESEES